MVLSGIQESRAVTTVLLFLFKYKALCYNKNMKKYVFMTVLVMFCASARAAAVIYQAESGVLSGTYADTTHAGYQGTGYVTGFDADNDSCSVTVNVPSAGMYKITIGYASPYGPKNNALYANNLFQASVLFPESAVFAQVEAGLVPLNAGNNTLKVVKEWGYFELDWFGVEAASLPTVSAADSLVNTNSSAATQCLMSFLADNYGKKIISGQDTLADCAWVNTATSRYPAICGFDMMDYSPSRVERGAVCYEAESATAWAAQNGIVQFQWHWNAPKDLLDTPDHEWWRGFYTHATTFDVEYAMNNPGSEDYNLIIRDIDAIAVQLKKLRDANVPVLWRPLHEAQGGWFWWGAKGPQACKQLYWLLYDRLTNHHGLNNLIWVWTTQDNAESVNWYPGDEYVDVLGADIYLDGNNYSPSTAMFYNIVSLFNGAKMVAMTENGTIPDPSLLQSQQAYWSWFMTWNGFENNPAQNSLSHVQSVYNSAYVLTRDEITAYASCKATHTATATATITGTPPTATVTATITVTPTPRLTEPALLVTGANIYPCPVMKNSGGFNIALTFEGKADTAKVSIYSLGFRKIYDREVTASGGSGGVLLHYVQLSEMAINSNGLYFMKAELKSADGQKAVSGIRLFNILR